MMARSSRRRIEPAPFNKPLLLKFAGDLGKIVGVIEHAADVAADDLLDVLMTEYLDAGRIHEVEDPLGLVWKTPSASVTSPRYFSSSLQLPDIAFERESHLVERLGQFLDFIARVDLPV